MQASPINAAQLMMEFLEREQVDIGQGIIATEFSRELEKQKLRIDGTSSETQTAPQKETLFGKPLSTSLPDTIEPAPSNPSKDAAATQRSKSLKRLVSDGRPMKDLRTKIQDEMLFTNPVLLEKVLADLKVPAEARKACTSAEDKQGRLPLGSLLNVLDKQTGDGASLNPGKAQGQDVEALIKSIALPRGLDTLAIQQLVTKPRGVYTLNELRQVLDKAVKQVQEARNLRTSTADASGQQATPLRQLKSGSGEKAPSVSTPTRSAPLMASSIPSFVVNNASENDPGRVSGKPSPAIGRQETASAPRQHTDSASRDLRAEFTRAQRSQSVSRLDTPTVEMSPHPGLGFAAKNGGASTESFLTSADILGRSGFADGSGRESIQTDVNIPGEQLAKARVISLGRNPVQEVQNILESLPLKVPELMASGKEWSATGETASLKEALQEPGLGEPQRPPMGIFTDPAVTLVKASDTSMAMNSGGSSAGNQRQRTSRLYTGTGKTIMDSRLTEPTRQDFPTMTTSPSTPEVKQAGRNMPSPDQNVPINASATNTSVKTSPGLSVSSQIMVTGKPRSDAEWLQNRQPTVSHDLMTTSREQMLPEATGAQLVQGADLPPGIAASTQSGGTPAPRVVPPSSRLDNAIDRTGEFHETSNAAPADVQDDVAPVRERFSMAVSTQFDSILDLETLNRDSQPAPKASESGFDSSKQTDDSTPNQQSFDSRGRAFMAYSPVSQGMPVNEAFQGALPGESLSLANHSWPMDMAQRIQELAKERQSSHLTLELEPKELGRLTLRVETRQEEVTATVTAEKEQAREVLLRNTHALRQNLEQQGLTLGQFLVDVRDERSGGGHHPTTDQRFAEHPHGGDTEEKNHRLPVENGIVWIRNDTSHLINVLA